MKRYLIGESNCIIKGCVEYTIKMGLLNIIVNLDEVGNGFVELSALNQERAIHFANKHIEIHKSCKE